MPSEFIQRQIDRLLEQAADALARFDWSVVRQSADAVLRFDVTNADALALLAAAGADEAEPPAPAVGAQFIAPAGPVGEGLVPSRRAPDAAASATGAAPPPEPTLLSSLPPSTSSGHAPREGGTATPVPDATPSRSTTDEPRPTTFLGRYKVERFLGEGGKKQVYLAHDAVLGRDVAFALIKTEGLDQTGRDRIRREGQAMGRLGSHPHIVTVFDLGELPPPSPLRGERAGERGQGQPYMVTELMKGGDVEGLLEKAPEHRLPLEQAVKLADEVCQGLEFAHTHGIVHRDLKPGNTWLTDHGTAKIGDFGLAVSLDRTRLTQAGTMVGTVGYMPPEQATGGAVTPRSDLYSLGAMLYEMVTGRPPFIGDDAVAIIGQHLNVPPVSPAWHRPDCPSGLEAIILHLLEKDPAKRPESATEVRQALASVAQAIGSRQAAIGPDAGPPTASANPMYGRVFVGREAELRQLTAAYDTAASGQGSLAMVVGEPGIGKTSVCEQLATYVAVRGGRALVGHCYEEGSLSLPYLPFVEALRSYVLQRDADSLRADLGSGAGEVARIVSEVRERLGIPPAPVNLADAEEERYRLFQAVAGFLRAAGQVQPLVIVLEDLHDADRGTLDLLVHLARQLAGSRLLLIGTYRDVEVDRAHPLSACLAELRRNAGFARVLLRGLTADEVQRMLSQLAGQELPWRLAEAVHRQTEGNPLFIQEVLRYLVEEGLITREDGRWRRASEETPLELGIPEGLRDVIGKRLGRLSTETNAVLATAAVMGREFRLDVLQRVAGLPEEALEAALAEAKAVAVVEERSAPGGAVSYRFTHAFFRQTLYEETIAPRRIRLHQQVARALEAVYGRRLEEHAAELAEHYAYSSDPADLSRAVSYGELAAARALQVYAYGEAERHLEQALKVQEVLDPDDRAKRCDLLLALGEAMLPAEDPGRIPAVVAEPAFALAEALGDSHRAARVAVLALTSLDRQLGLAQRSARPVEPWTERVQRHAADGSRERILGDVYTGIYRIGASGPASGHPYIRRAAEAALQTDDQTAFFTSMGLAFRALAAVQDRDLVQVIADAVLGRSRQDVSANDLGVCLLLLGFILLERGDRDAAERAWGELHELAERTHDVRLRLGARATDVWSAFLDGRLDLAASLLSEVLALAAEAGTAALGYTTPILVYPGHDQEILALRAIANPSGRADWAIGAWCLAHLGRHDDARALRQRFGDLGSETDETASRMLALLLESAVLGGDVEAVQAVTHRLDGMARFPCVIHLCLSWPRILGAAAALLGERERAQALYEQAIEGLTRLRHRPELALTHLQYAELLLDEGHGSGVMGIGDETTTDKSTVGRGLAPRRPVPESGTPAEGAGKMPALPGNAVPLAPEQRAEAMRHLDIAIAEFRDMKMQPFLERALRHKDLLHA